MKNTDDLIKNAKNRVFIGGLGLGKNNPVSLHTIDTSIYRVTGLNQIEDIINCGYVRPKAGKLKGGHEGEIFWTLGGEKLFYYDGRPVIEVSANMVKDNQIGGVALEDLKAIWIFDKGSNSYKNYIEYIKKYRQIAFEKNTTIKPGSLETVFNTSNINEEHLTGIFNESRQQDMQQRQVIRQQQLEQMQQHQNIQNNIEIEQSFEIGGMKL